MAAQRCPQLFDHLAPSEHPDFYAAQRLTLNVTRVDMVRAGWSPSVRLFEAGACAVPVITDAWPGVDELFRPGHDILVAREANDVVRILRDDVGLFKVGLELYLLAQPVGEL